MRNIAFHTGDWNRSLSLSYSLTILYQVDMESPTPEDLPSPELDAVDKVLAKDRGLIERPLNPMMCQHNEKGKCVHCSPLEPYDSDYLKDKEIKHMSFYSYIIQCTSGVSGKSWFQTQIIIFS